MAEAKQITKIEDIKLEYDLSIYNCQHFGTYKAIVYEDQVQTREYTNVELAQEATQLAAGLQALGIKQGDRIIVMLPNSPEVLISYQAIARAGAVIIPVLPLLKPLEVRYIAENSGARVIISSPLLLPLLASALVDVPSMQYLVITGDSVGSADLTGTPSSYEILAYSEVVASAAALADHYLSDLPGVRVTPEDTAVILYTSGTTGKPKGVVLLHRNLVSNAVSGHGTTRIEEGHDVQLAILPLAHAYGLLASNVTYLSGARIVMHPRFDTGAVLAAIEHHKITGFAGVPAMFVALLYTPDGEKYDTSSLQYCVSGSAPLPLAILQGFEKKFGCQILEGYGLSEAMAALTGHRSDRVQKPGSVGQPLPGIEVRVVDEQGKELPVGELGEVIARGPNIMQGYYNLPQETSEALRDGWLYTGDMGRFDEDGYLYIVERKKDLIIRGGFNVYPRDIEEVLNGHPAVIESAVVGIPSERMGEEVKAFVVTSSSIDAETLMTYCRDALANYKTPSEIEFVTALPRNAIGKIDKKELRKRYVH